MSPTENWPTRPRTTVSITSSWSSTRKFLQTIITRVDANDEIFKKILDNEDFRATLGEFYLRKVYDRPQASSATG